jgi:dihydropteroate synthase
MEAPIQIFDPPSWPPRPLLMGIVNVTPDSFSDGGALLSWERAVAHGLRLIDEGADLLDIGGESTRPGSSPVSLEEELGRVLPVLRALHGETDRPLSIDTRKPEVAREALKAGARLVNDVGGLREPEMTHCIASAQAGVVIMHMQGEPQTMQVDPRYGDVLTEIRDTLEERARIAQELGIGRSRIWIDPGIGFGKRLEHNLQLLAGLDRLASLGYPVLLGASRKGFIGEISGDPVYERLAGSLAAAGHALDLPRAIVRVHDVAATRQYLLVRQRIERARSHPDRPADPS